MAKKLTSLLWIGTVLLSLLLGINIATAQHTSPILCMYTEGSAHALMKSSSVVSSHHPLSTEIKRYSISFKSLTEPVKHPSPQTAKATDHVIWLYGLLVGLFLLLQRSVLCISPNTKGLPSRTI